MELTYCTIFPGLIDGALKYGIFAIAEKKGVAKYRVVNIRDFAVDKHGTVDDYPYGGGPGMIMMAPPIVEAVEAQIPTQEMRRRTTVILLDPAGDRFDQRKAFELSKREGIIFICGHYKGVDDRVRELVATEVISIGDYILSGGELPALIITEAVIRYLPGVLGDERSRDTDSFSQDRVFALDCAYYTRPPEYRGLRVPEVLLSGNHSAIEKWRQKSAIERTKKYRPELLDEKDVGAKKDDNEKD